VGLRGRADRAVPAPARARAAAARLRLQHRRAELLGGLLADSRIRLVEVAEYAALRDVDQRSVGALVTLLAGALRA
jgi:hypothetical protein